MGPAQLAQVLRGLPEIADPGLLVGAAHSDDAAVYKIADDLAIVMTVDVFTPVVDDPYVYGQIAAANSFGDVYAMGARPLIALSVVGFPQTGIDLSILTRILRGGMDKAAEAGAPIAGGHTIDDPEIKYGLAVTGLIHPDEVITNAGARPGDVLILTKPVGVGILTTAARADRIGADALKPAVELMARLNRAASEAMQEVGVHAATDVTGFGLVGHAHEIAAASGCALEIVASAVPLVGGLEELVAERVFSGGLWRNHEHYGQFVEVASGVDENLVYVLFDPQTSGGLLIAAPADAADDLMARLRERGVSDAARIGRVTDGQPGTLRLLP